MSVDAYITLAIILVAFILFATEYLSVDHVALGIMVTLVVTGVLTPEESVEGFANSATITVAAMFVLGDALIKTGIIESVGPLFVSLLKRGYRITILGLSGAVGGISAFINNTPVVATFIPILAQASRQTDKKLSLYLIPLSYGAILGGTCTLVGTSTNLLVDGIARSKGLQGFDMFTFAPLGIVFFGVGLLYLIFIAPYLLPDRQPLDKLEESGKLKDYLTEIKVVKSIPEDKGGKPISQSIARIFEYGDNKNVQVKRVLRNKKVHQQPADDFELEKGDVLLVQGDQSHIKDILTNEYLEMTDRLGDREFPEEETRLLEIVILPNAHLVGQKLDNIDFFKRYHSRVLALRHRGKQKFSDLGKMRLQAGDVLLLQTSEEGYEMLYKIERRRQAPFLFLSESGIETVDEMDLLKVSAIIVSVIALATFQVLPLMTAALAAVFLLVIMRLMSMERVYKAIDWQVIILLAGALSLGAAMTKSGLSEQIAHLIDNVIAEKYGPVAVIAALYLSTSLLTEVMSNNAAAALLAPIAITIAASLGLSHLPFLLAITFAGSASFMTPIGYQTNTMVYSAGNYRFTDFLKVGLPLDLLLWIVASLLIPVFYPF